MDFKTALSDDVKIFTNANEFGESAIFSRSGKTVNILLDKDQEPETGRWIDIVTVALSDIVGIQVDDTFTVGTTVYVNESIEPIPQGELMCSLRVRKQ